MYNILTYCSKVKIINNTQNSTEYFAYPYSVNETEASCGNISLLMSNVTVLTTKIKYSSSSDWFGLIRGRKGFCTSVLIQMVAKPSLYFSSGRIVLANFKPEFRGDFLRKWFETSDYRHISYIVLKIFSNVCFRDGTPYWTTGPSTRFNLLNIQ